MIHEASPRKYKWGYKKKIKQNKDSTVHKTEHQSKRNPTGKPGGPVNSQSIRPLTPTTSARVCGYSLGPIYKIRYRSMATSMTITFVVSLSTRPWICWTNRQTGSNIIQPVHLLILHSLIQKLTNISLLNLPTLISRSSPFPVLEALGGIFFLFYLNFDITFCKQHWSTETCHKPLE